MQSIKVHAVSPLCRIYILPLYYTCMIVRPQCLVTPKNMCACCSTGIGGTKNCLRLLRLERKRRIHICKGTVARSKVAADARTEKATRLVHDEQGHLPGRSSVLTARRAGEPLRRHSEGGLGMAFCPLSRCLIGSAA